MQRYDVKITCLIDSRNAHVVSVARLSKFPVILLCVQVFQSVFLCPDIFIQGILKLRRHLDTETYGSWHGIFVISHVELQINAEISRQN